MSDTRPIEIPLYPGVTPFRLEMRDHPESDEILYTRFIDDDFRPNYSSASRVAIHQVIKGTAVQQSYPLHNMSIVIIGNGAFLSKKDHQEFIKMYHNNYIGKPDPYPTDYLVLREEYATLVFPSGHSIKVKFSGANPQCNPIFYHGKRWTYSLQCQFDVVDDEDND